MKILLLSAYDAASHQRWRSTLTRAFPEHNWTVLTLPARYFSWRIRGNSLSWAFEQRSVLTEHYDLLIATSMVDLSSLRGFVPELSQCPTLVYFHENQFDYPESGRQHTSVEPQVLSLYTALAADKIVFNSYHNRDSFFKGSADLLGRLPDHIPGGLLDRLKTRCAVIPVPLERECFSQTQKLTNAPLALVWNHRWEFDKAPERLFAALKLVLEQGTAIHLYILGQQFRQQPPVFEQMYNYLTSHHQQALKQWGFVASESEYRRILMSADVVVSTALHDFQGLAVLEAVAAGCIPALPDRLCYGQWFDSAYLYNSHIRDEEVEALALANRIVQLAKLKQNAKLAPPPDISHLCVNELKQEYTQIFIETINQRGQQRMEPV
jgi:glycosyltransferase involved in cell wall biosynthesis